MVGLLLLIAVGAYVVLYALNSAGMDRYAMGFPVQQCPVCGGTLALEERPYRSAGIPRARRTVRCTDCRSVLREVGRRRWRYAVDRNANPTLFAEYNEKTLTESDLQRLAPTSNRPEAPLYVEE